MFFQWQFVMIDDSRYHRGLILQCVWGLSSGQTLAALWFPKRDSEHTHLALGMRDAGSISPRSTHSLSRTLCLLNVCPSKALYSLRMNEINSIMQSWCVPQSQATVLAPASFSQNHVLQYIKSCFQESNNPPGNTIAITNQCWGRNTPQTSVIHPTSVFLFK